MIGWDLYSEDHDVRLVTGPKVSRFPPFPVAAPEVSEPSRGDAGLQAAISLEKGLKSKAPELYSGDTQKSFDTWIRECANEFDL